MEIVENVQSELRFQQLNNFIFRFKTILPNQRCQSFQKTFFLGGGGEMHHLHWQVSCKLALKKHTVLVNLVGAFDRNECEKTDGRAFIRKFTEFYMAVCPVVRALASDAEGPALNLAYLFVSTILYFEAFE